MSDMQDRARKLIDQAITNLVKGLNCSTDTALQLLLIQSAIRLPVEEVNKSLHYILNPAAQGEEQDVN